MATGDVYEVQVTALTPAGTLQNTLHFITTTPDEANDAHFLAIGNAMKELHRASQASTVQYQTYRARRIRGSDVEWPATGPCGPVGGVVFEGNLTGTLTGGGIGDALPWQCALVTTIKSSIPGRRHRGRYYAGGFNEPSQAGGLWNSSELTTAATNWQSFYNAYAVVAPVSGYRLGIWSTTTANGGCFRTPSGDHIRPDDPDPDSAFTPTNDFVTRATVFTQRRRVIGHGS